MKKIGFTLSEVLLTLTIIGFIAVLTVNPLFTYTRESEYKSALKKAIDMINEALLMERAATSFGARDYMTKEELVDNLFKKRLKIVDKDDEKFTSEDCEGAVFTTTDGIIFCVDNYSVSVSDTGETVCNSNNTKPCTASDSANLWIDVNGLKKPNKVTTSSDRPQDIYLAQIYNQKAVVFGQASQEFFYNRKTDDKI